MEKLLAMRNQLIKTTIICAIILGIASIIGFSGTHYVGSVNNDLAKIKKEGEKIQSEINNIKNNRTNALTAYERFRDIKKNRRATKDGYITSVSRQIVAKALLTELSAKYKFTNMDPKLTPPEKEDFPNLAFTSVTSNLLSLKFDGMSDELVFAFISAIQEKLPGYLKLTKLNISRKSDIDIDMLEKIKLTNSYLPLVSGDIEFKWYTLMSKLAKDEEVEE